MLEQSRPPPPHHLLLNTPELSSSRAKHEYNHSVQQRYYSRHEPFHPSADERRSSGGGGTYQNLETEAIYGNTTQGGASSGYYEQESMYANRAYVEFERRAAAVKAADEAAAAAAASNPLPPSGRRVVRRHSMADRHEYPQRMTATTVIDGGGGGADAVAVAGACHQPHPPAEREDIYMTRSGAFMMQNSYNRREEEAIYQSRREMHRDHLYQSKAEMQQRLHASRARRAHTESPMTTITQQTGDDITSSLSSPMSPTSSGSGGGGGSAAVLYQSRQELKERGFRTRTQLRDHIYQSRLEAMQSMAEPVYVSRREVCKQTSTDDPIYETREVAEGASASDVRTIDGSDEMSPTEIANDLNGGKSSESTAAAGAAAATTVDMILNLKIDSMNESNEDGAIADESTLTNAGVNQSDLQKCTGDSLKLDNIECNEQPRVAVATPSSGRRPLPPPNGGRSPFHLSSMLKRTAPPVIEHNLGDQRHPSCTSIETQYTTQSSFNSLAMGSPDAQSTPYASEMVLENGGGGSAAGSGSVLPIREQSTSRGTFDENGGTLCDNVWNVSINIPPGAIRPGVKQEIYFTVTDPRLSQAVGGPPLDMENGLFCWPFFECAFCVIGNFFVCL